jgi:hypothetical protein
MFEALIQQVVQDNILTAIVSIFASAAIIIPIAMKMVAKINPKLEVVGQYGDTFGQKGAEITDDLYMLADVIKTTTPEAENYLRTKYGKDISYFETRAKIAAQQATRFQNKLTNEDPNLLAKSDPNIPREPFNTKPGQSRAGV